MVDVMGSVTDEQVIRASWSKATVDKIGFENFDSKNIWAVADKATVVPAFIG